jgi:hypothetical protein
VESMGSLNMVAIQGSAIELASGNILTPQPIECTAPSNLAGLEISDSHVFVDGKPSAAPDVICLLDDLHQAYGKDELALYLLHRSEINPSFVTKVLPEIVRREQARRVA